MGSFAYQQKLARILAFKICYQRIYLGIMPLSEQYLISKANLAPKARDYLLGLLYTKLEKRQQIDVLIKNHLIGWKKSRIDPLFNIVLELSVVELVFLNAATFKIVINEAVDFIKHNVSLEAAKMGNALLDKVYQDSKNQI